MRIRSILTGLALYMWGFQAEASTVDFDAFANSQYTYCDAKILSSKWTNANVYDSKALIGLKLRSGASDVLDEMLHSARMDLRVNTEKQCRF